MVDLKVCKKENLEAVVMVSNQDAQKVVMLECSQAEKKVQIEVVQSEYYSVVDQVVNLVDYLADLLGFLQVVHQAEMKAKKKGGNWADQKVGQKELQTVDRLAESWAAKLAEQSVVKKVALKASVEVESKERLMVD